MKTGIGLIGCGNISAIYCEAGRKFDAIEIVACADIDPAKARALAAEYDIPKALSVEDLLADPEVGIVLNLTVPVAHAEVSQAALRAGKAVYSEKPLGIRREEGRAVLALADAGELRVGCAPDTFLGGGLQTCRKLIDDGCIGEPIAATAFMLSHGAERWHPNPGFYYQPGGGPMFDMGPYYLTALTTLLGPIRRVCGSARPSFKERVFTDKHGKPGQLEVAVDTHVAAILDFHRGAIATIVTSFDVWAHRLPHIEIYGTEGSLAVPDPNCFGGPVSLRRAGDADWSDVPLAFGYTENCRGIGLADMAAALASGGSHRASSATAFHVLDVMQAVHEASASGKFVDIESSMERPAPLSADLQPGEVY